ncbi:hypothetical protein Tsubulata_027428 [Turnera subulata]|uniref:NB-ARC domain-containing protein n=1 Tax=Turnera subulata TaxID=218843 RepID=A0A9Q0JK81_9ROSI|nr:hypothetical protein Tsubulata_027428 [Turnera subulata]
MGGSGKTTLIAKAYNCEIVKRHFECSAWITVSQSYSIEHLFRTFIRQFYKAANEAIPLDLTTMSYRELIEMLVNYLERRKYVVVLDDVWDTELWNKIKVALPNGQNGCRVIITTRIEDIAATFFEVGSNIHHIKPMEKDEAWTLFCMKAFPWNARRCPQELENLAKDVVEKCQGLPLAVVSLGGLFSTKRSELEWKTTYNSLNWELSNNTMLQPIKSILLLSYNDLPYRLKHCFLYCCLFPEDYIIKRKRLARSWMAEGFIEKVRGLTPEEIADRYLVELIRRSLLQMLEMDSYGLPGKCKMHDMLRELAISKSEEEKFCALYDERIGARVEEESIGRLYNLEMLNIGETQVEAPPNGIVKLKSLRYLLSYHLNEEMLYDFGYVCGTQFPQKLSNLSNLQFLGIVEANSFVMKEIQSMAQLVRLEISNIKGSDEEDLCFAIQNMPLLRRLLVKAAKEDQILRLDALKSPPPFLEQLVLIGRLENIPQWFHALQNLRRLSLVGSRLMYDPLSHLETLPSLRHLHLLKFCEELHLEFKNGFHNLQSLHVYNCSNLQSITIAKGVMSGIKYLEIISCGMLKEVPSGINYLTKLEELVLENLAEDLIKRIEPSGVDRPNVQHIPEITYFYQTSSGWFKRNLSSS